MTHVPTPRPGSRRALEHGCTCPVIGQGIPGNDGGRWYWFSADCPLHKTGEWASPVKLDTSITPPDVS